MSEITTKVSGEKKTGKWKFEGQGAAMVPLNKDSGTASVEGSVDATYFIDKQNGINSNLSLSKEDESGAESKSDSIGISGGMFYQRGLFFDPKLDEYAKLSVGLLYGGSLNEKFKLKNDEWESERYNRFRLGPQIGFDWGKFRIQTSSVFDYNTTRGAVDYLKLRLKVQNTFDAKSFPALDVLKIHDVKTIFDSTYARGFGKDDWSEIDMSVLARWKLADGIFLGVGGGVAIDPLGKSAVFSPSATLEFRPVDGVVIQFGVSYGSPINPGRY